MLLFLTLHVMYRCLGPVKVEGRQHVCVVYEILAPADPSSAPKKASIQPFSRGVLAYQQQKFEQAVTLFTAIGKIS